MNLKVNQEACIGCGACVALDPEHFAFNDEGLSTPISQENLESETLHNAMDSCPTGAISFTDEEVKVEAQDDEDCSCDDCDGHCCCHEEA